MLGNDGPAVSLLQTGIELTILSKLNLCFNQQKLAVQPLPQIKIKKECQYACNLTIT
jgi:hypothetical protein